jgi:lycopene beta-cyclase
VLDGRGPAPTPGWYESCAFQKFVGLELTVDPAAAAAAFAPEQALVMDATVPQHDGFRFVYVLPLAPDRLLVEDTYYSDEPALDRPTLRARIGGYLAQRGVHPLAVLREEAGVLPLPMADSGVPPLGSPVRLGARGGWLHPTTGYTLPLAVRVALIVAGTGGQADDAISALARHHRQHARQAHFFRRLNRLLFRAVAPQRRWQMLSRFYRLPPVTIARFYAADTTPGDRARILVGRPPRGVSLPAAFAALQAA